MTIEQHYRLKDVACRLGISYEYARQLFRNDCVVVGGRERSTRDKRRYISRRVPESAITKVLAKGRQFRL